MEIAEVVMNPVRQRIFQYFLLHETGTVKELKKALPDVPNASLYRHIKILADHSILIVVGENRIRGGKNKWNILLRHAVIKADVVRTAFARGAAQLRLVFAAANDGKYESPADFARGGNKRRQRKPRHKPPAEAKRENFSAGKRRDGIVRKNRFFRWGAARINRWRRDKTPAAVVLQQFRVVTEHCRSLQ